MDELEVQALQAKTPAQKAAIAEERRRLELSGQAVPAAIAEADIVRAGTKARAEATQGIIDQSRVLEVNVKATLGLADAWLKGAAAAQAAEARRKALTNFAVQTPDAASFRRAQSQITADLASALRRAERNL